MDTNVLQNLRNIFPNHIPQMEKAVTEEERNTIYKELLQEQRSILRRELAKAGIEETHYQDLLSDSTDEQILPAMLFDSVIYDEVVNAEGDKVKTIVQALYQVMELLKGKEDASTTYVSACLVANNLIALGETGISAARKTILEYSAKHTDSTPKLDKELQDVLQELTKEAQQTVLCAAPVALPAAFAATSSTGPGVVIAVISIILAVLASILLFMAKGAAAILLVVNDITNTLPPGAGTDSYGLYFDSSKNIHGKQTGYTSPGLKPAVIANGDRFLSTGFYTTEKKTAALYGTKYGVRFNIPSTNIYVAFGAECPLTGNNKCFCGFGKTAEEAAAGVTANLSAEDSSGNYKAKIVMNSKSGSTAYYIARVYNE